MSRIVRNTARRRVPRTVQEMPPEMNLFIQNVITEYRLQRRVTILHHELETREREDIGRHSVTYVLRLNLTLKSGDVESQSSVIIKIPHLSRYYAECKGVGFYAKEAFMYKTVLPRFRQIWSGGRMFPIFYAASDVGMILALENLEESGFRLLPETSPLDLNQCDIMLKGLARFHAVSVKYFERFGTGQFDAKVTFFIDAHITHDMFAKIRQYVLPSLSADHRPKWVHFQENYEILMNDLRDQRNRRGGFNVMLHGDLQSHNVLLKDDECKFIDFQLTFRASPVLDLIHFFVHSAKREEFEQHREHIFTHYLGALNEVLGQLRCAKRYSLNELSADFEKYKLYCVFVMSCIIPTEWSKIETMQTMNQAISQKLEGVLRSEKCVSLFKDWMDVISDGILAR